MKNLNKKSVAATIIFTLLFSGILVSMVGLAPLVTASTVPSVEWNRQYGGSETDMPLQVQQTREGGYALIGITYSYGDATQGDGWLVKTFANGTMQWSKKYGGANIDTFYAGEQTIDGGYILAGSTTSSRPAQDLDAWLVKTDANGNSVWSRSIGGSSHDYIFSVKQTSDGGYIVARRTYDDNQGTIIAWLDKTDQTGNVIWSRQYATFTGWQGEAWIRSVQQTDDGGYVFAGFTAISPSLGDFWIVKTNSSGHVLWDRKYGGTAMDEAASVQPTRDGGYIVAGFTMSYGAGQSDAWLVKVNSTGHLAWSQTYGGINSDQAMSVQQTLDGGYIFSGESQSTGAGAWLVKTASNGTMEWNRNYGDVYGFLRGYSVQQTNDGGYIVGGDCYSAITGSVDGFLLKLMGEDADGDGLLDSWEKEGIDYNNDGIIDLDLKALGADWQHKDIFVEVDYMPGHYPNSDAMTDVQSAFADAPVTNPDGLPGIKLHVDVDEQVPHIDQFRPLNYEVNDFDILKSSYFGTPTQRSDVNSLNILGSKELVYRYCLFIHDFIDWNGTQWVKTTSGGMSERPGNDFFVSLGGWSTNPGTRDEQAATFMHELGHTLSLRHGGGDDINFKPNYLSIMNYAFQTSYRAGWRPLDYSRRELPYLQEGGLNEPAGIQGSGFWLYTIWNNSQQVYKRGLTFGPLDWNGDGNFSYLVQANINNFPGWHYTSDPMELLMGYDDWDNLKFDFRDTQNFANGVHLQMADPEITWETAQTIRDSVLAMHDVAVFNVSSPMSVWGQGNALSVNVTLGNLGGSDENVAVTVYANSALIASSTLLVKADNLTSVTLPYTGEALNPGTYALTATVSQVPGETYTADNSVTGGTITVTEVVPEFSPVLLLAALVILTLALALITRKKQKPCAQ